MASNVRACVLHLFVASNFEESTAPRDRRRATANGRGRDDDGRDKESSKSRRADKRQRPRVVYDKYQLAAMNPAEVGTGACQGASIFVLLLCVPGFVSFDFHLPRSSLQFLKWFCCVA